MFFIFIIEHCVIFQVNYPTRCLGKRALLSVHLVDVHSHSCTEYTTPKFLRDWRIFSHFSMLDPGAKIFLSGSAISVACSNICNSLFTYHGDFLNNL